MRTPFSLEFFQVARTLGVRPFKWVHSYVYFTYTRQYVGTGLALGRRLPRIPGFLRRWAVTNYRGKATPLGDAKKLLRVNQEIDLKGLERMIPLAEARNVVLSTGDRILLAECACRELRENPCKPTQVCMFFGKEVAPFVHRQKPEKTRWIGQDEAIQVLEDAHARGWSHLTFSREISADRFFVICNCCACCCAAFETVNAFKVPVLHESGYKAVVSGDCLGCGLCVKKCPVEACSISPETSRAVVDLALCLGCGACLPSCKQEALSLEPAPDGLQPILGY
ncbi:MAG: hypothetical protein KKA60_15165 [Proteobacteria bacterium]|nr:hypothetical protein [Pseudomonadota bacterium]